MTISHTRTAKTYSAIFGFYPGQMEALSSPEYVVCNIDVGWLDLKFGFDEARDVLLLASTGCHRFEFTANPSPESRHSVQYPCRNWVYILQENPEEYLASAIPIVEMAVAGFRFVSGVDSSRRQYLYVVLSEGDQYLLFRNPKSRSVTPWSPPGARQFEGRKEEVSDKALPAFADTTGDPELDKLLAVMEGWMTHSSQR